MAWPDMVNGTWELFGAPFILLSIIKLYKDKKVKGVSWVHAGFFAIWGYWNLFYYPHLDQWWSFFGGMATTITNTVWISQLIYYTRKGKKNEMSNN